MEDDLLKVTLLDRKETHGDYPLQAAICQRLQDVMKTNSGNWLYLDADQKDALEMVATKISRILAGDPNHKDSWLDGAGYFSLIANRLD